MTTEPPDLSAELRRQAERRIAKIRHRNRQRAALKAARDAGLIRRHAAKLARIAEQKGQQP